MGLIPIRRRKVRKGAKYIYNPVGMDIWDARTSAVKGQKVKVIHPHGCPPPNTMGHVHIESESGEFLGLVLSNSLLSEKEYKARQKEESNS